METSAGTDGIARRAEKFFSEALGPIVETHHAARESKIELSRLKDMLGRRTAELFASAGYALALLDLQPCTATLAGAGGDAASSESAAKRPAATP